MSPQSQHIDPDTPAYKAFIKVFGKSMFESACLSKTLLKLICRAHESKVKYKLLNGVCMAYYDSNKNTIYIGKFCPRNYKIISVAHEISHAVIRRTVNPIPGVTGRKEFIESCIDDETESIVQELKVLVELKNAGIKFHEKEERWLKAYKSGGRRTIRKILKTTITSTTLETYPTYYSGWYDQIVPKSKRLP